MQEDVAIVLRSAPFQERDRLVHLLTEQHGKIAGIAKGAIHSRRFGGSLDLFTCINVKYVDKPGRDLVRIESAEIKRDFSAIRQNLERIGAAGYFSDLCFRLCEERSPVRDVFLLLAHYLYLLEQVEVTPAIIRSFEIKLLDRLGYSPAMEACVECGASIVPSLRNPEVATIAFSVERGGIICPNCIPNHQGRRVQSSTIAWLHSVRHTPIRELPKLTVALAALSEGADLWKDFLRYHGPGLDQYSFRTHEWLEELIVAR